MPPLAPAYYAYWSGLPTDGFDTYIRAESGRGWAAIPTHDDLTCVVQGLAAGRVRGQPQGRGGHVPEVLRASRPSSPSGSTAPRGSRASWARETSGATSASRTVPDGRSSGDAGYHKHPITAFGITDAFRDAEALASALDDAFTERRPFDDAMADYQRARDEDALPIYEFTCDFAKLEPPPPEMQQLIGAMHGNQEAMDGFVSVMAGTLPAPEFFAPENAGRIIAQAAP